MREEGGREGEVTAQGKGNNFHKINMHCYTLQNNTTCINVVVIYVGHQFRLKFNILLVLIFTRANARQSHKFSAYAFTVQVIIFHGFLRRTKSGKNKSTTEIITCTVHVHIKY